MSEIYDLLRPLADDEFWNFGSYQASPGIYVFGRQQMTEFRDKILELSRKPDYCIVFGNSAEGSTTLTAQLEVLGLTAHVQAGRVLLISGGALPDNYAHLTHEHFLTRILDYIENLDAMSKSHLIFDTTPKPWSFLFLNGRARPHRKYLFERLQQSGSLDKSLWTMLDGRGSSNRVFSLQVAGVDLMQTNSPIKMLPDQYEVDRYRGNRINTPNYPHQFVKYDLFKNEWGDIYLDIAPYRDTYFSLVTETVFETRDSFRTEKIAKPLAMAHPWICATNAGFYQDMHDLGFQSFDHLIDESFDGIDNAQDRMDRIVTIVDDLCTQDLDSFLAAAESVCKYNQQHLSEVIAQERGSFAQRFHRFIDAHARS